MSSIENLSRMWSYACTHAGIDTDALTPFQSEFRRWLIADPCPLESLISGPVMLEVMSRQLNCWADVFALLSQIREAASTTTTRLPTRSTQWHPGKGRCDRGPSRN